MLQNILRTLPSALEGSLQEPRTEGTTPASHPYGNDVPLISSTFQLYSSPPQVTELRILSEDIRRVAPWTPPAVPVTQCPASPADSATALPVKPEPAIENVVSHPIRPRYERRVDCWFVP